MQSVYRENSPKRKQTYELPLLLKDAMIQPPSNKELSLTVSRLDKLIGRLESNEAYGKDYQAFMKEVIDKGYAERAPAEELALENSQIWHILHHGVYNHPHPPPPKKKSVSQLKSWLLRIVRSGTSYIMGFITINICPMNFGKEKGRGTCTCTSNPS